MERKISMTLSEDSIDKAIHELQSYEQFVREKAVEICRRLAVQGEVQISVNYALAVYKGNKDYSVTVEERPNGYAIVADGETVLILEFGAGATYGYGHPLANQMGLGPGTYPEGRGHWNDPKGWYLPKDADYSGGRHTYGNSPSKAMYNAAVSLRQSIERVAQEVFRE